jgi:hypothetical protein
LCTGHICSPIFLSLQFPSFLYTERKLFAANVKCRSKLRYTLGSIPAYVYIDGVKHLSKLIHITWPPLWSSRQSSWLHNGDVLCFLWSTNWIYICYVEESRLLLWSSGQSSWLQNGALLCFLWGTNWIYICYIEEGRPPLWSSGHSSWLQIQRSGFDFRRYEIFWEAVGLERGPLSLVSTTEELLERKSSGSGPETENMAVGIRHADHVVHSILERWH